MARYTSGRYPSLKFYTKFRDESYSFKVGVFQTDDYAGEEKSLLIAALDNLTLGENHVNKDIADTVNLTDCSYPGCDRTGERGFTSMAKMYGHLGQHKKEN